MNPAIKKVKSQTGLLFFLLFLLANCATESSEPDIQKFELVLTGSYDMFPDYEYSKPLTKLTIDQADIKLIVENEKAIDLDYNESVRLHL